jgi:hypothetical protein
MAKRYEKLKQGRLRDGRVNHILADSIDVGIIYWEIFGTEAAYSFLMNYGVSPAVASRVLAGPRRRWDWFAEP